MSKVKKILEFFASNEQSGSLREAFGRWLFSPIDAQTKSDAMKEFWDSIDVEADDSTRRAYLRLLERVGGEMPPVERHKSRPLFATILRWSAAVTIPVVAMVATHLYMNNQEREVEWIEVYTSHSQHQQVILPDNSLIELNPCSMLVYPETFGRTTRRVFLSGEAYATISKDRKRPFVISTGDIDVLVHGTIFNIESYFGNDEVEVALVEGSVSVVPKSVGHSNVTLQPGEMMRLNRRSGAVEVVSINTELVMPSESGHNLCFIDRNLQDVANHLERVFDVSFIISDLDLREERFFFAFANGESLEDVIKIFRKQGLDVECGEDDIIYLSRQ